MDSRYWFDATTLMKLRRYAPVGLSRVEANVLEGAMKWEEHHVRFCHFRRSSSFAQELPAEFVQQMLGDYRNIKPKPKRQKKRHPLLALGRNIEIVVRKGLMRPIQQAANKLKKDEQRVDFQSGDWLVISGSTWDTLEPRWVRQLASRGVRIATVLADMIPWKFPHHFHDAATVEAFEAMAEVFATSASAVASISQSTDDDFRDFAKQRSIASPSSRVILLGTEAKHESRKPEGIPDDFLDRGFVISVSTIQVRKNHQLLYNLWRRFAEEGRMRVPRLIIVGSPGWLTNDLQRLLSNDPMIQIA